MKPFKNTFTLLGILILLIFVVVVGRKFSASRGVAQSMFKGFKRADITEVTIKGKGAPVVLTLFNTWIVASADSFPANTAHLNRILAIVSGMDAGTIVSQNPAKQELFQVDSSAGVRVTVAAGNTIVADLYLGKDGPGNTSTYFRQVGSRDVYVYTKKSIRYEFNENSSRWRDTFIMAFKKNTLASFSLKYPQSVVEVRKGVDAVWRLIQPEEAAAQQRAVSALVNTLSSLTSKDMMHSNAGQSYGFNTPLCTITAVMADDSTQGIIIGSKVAERKEELYYVRRINNAGFVYMLRKHQFDALMMHVEDLKEVALPPSVSDQ